MINRLLAFGKYLNRQRNLKIKPLKMAIKLALLNRKKVEKTLLTPHRYKNVAILMNDQGIGDAIVTSFLIHTLRQNHFKVYVVAEKRIAFLFDEFISVDGVFLYDKKQSLKVFSKQIQNTKIDLAIDLVDKGNNSVRRSQVLVCLQPEHVIGFNHMHYNLYDTSVDYQEYSSHIITRSIKVLEILKIQFDNPKYYVNNPLDITRLMNEWITTSIEPQKAIVVFNPFGSNEARSFSKTQIDVILDFLSRQENIVTIVVGEKDKINQINVQDKDHIIINPHSSFFATVALIELSNLVITVDTSIVHISAIYDKRMVCVYNNRLIDDKFINNHVWGPNYNNAVQLFTDEYLGTGLGDPISGLSTETILTQLRIEFDKLDNTLYS